MKRSYFFCNNTYNYEAKAVVWSVATMAHDQKVVGWNPITGILDGSGVKVTQVWLIHPAWCFLDASNDCWSHRVLGSKKNDDDDDSFKKWLIKFFIQVVPLQKQGFIHSSQICGKNDSLFFSVFAKDCDQPILRSFSFLTHPCDIWWHCPVPPPPPRPPVWRDKFHFTKNIAFSRLLWWNLAQNGQEMTSDIFVGPLSTPFVIWWHLLRPTDDRLFSISANFWQCLHRTGPKTWEFNGSSEFGRKIFDDFIFVLYLTFWSNNVRSTFFVFNFYSWPNKLQCPFLFIIYIYEDSLKYFYGRL